MARVALRRTAPPAIEADTVISVSDAFLALLYWRDVPVWREVRQELTLLERLLLEAAVALETVGGEDLEELISLPRSVLNGGMSRLLAGGAVRRDGEVFRVVRDVAARFLAQEAVTRRVESTADFVLLPRSGDLLVISTEGGRGWLRKLDSEQLIPSTNAPAPRELWRQRRAAYLDTRVRAGTVAGVGADITAVCEQNHDRPLLPATGAEHGSGEAQVTGVCPAYRCHAEVRRAAAGHHAVRAVLRGETRHGRRPRSSDPEDADGAEVEIDLTGAVALVESWIELAGILDDPAMLRAAWQEIGPPGAEHAEPAARRRAPSEWEFQLTGSAAAAVADQGRALTEPVGLAVEGEEAVVELLCRFVPADDQARALFTRDAALSALLRSKAPADEFDATCHGARVGLAAPSPYLSAEGMRARIWQLGYYRLAYALRERADFPHD